MANCKGWEWCSNHRTNCRVCNAQLEPPNGEYDRQKQQARKSSRGKSPRSPHSRKDRERAKVDIGLDNASATSSTDANAGLLPLFQSRLPELREQFPDLAKSLEEAIKPVQVSPAAALHGAQSQCQQAFKTVCAAEQIAVDLEWEASDMVTQLRGKVRELHDAQQTLSAARANYDKKAKAAQDEVQKSLSQPEASHVSALVQELEPDDLARVAQSLAEAAEAKRKEKEKVVQELVEEVSRDVDSKVKKPLPKPLAAPGNAPSTPEGTGNADHVTVATEQGLQPSPADVEMPPQASVAPIEAPIEMPPVDAGANQVLPPVDTGATFNQATAPANAEASASSQSPSRPASVPARQRSRSPRDSSVRAASAQGDEVQPDQKKSKVGVVGDAPFSTSEFLGPQHFEDVANQMADQLKTMGGAGITTLPNVQAGDA